MAPFSLVVTDTDGNTSTADTVNIVVYDSAVYTNVVTGIEMSEVNIGSSQSYLIIGSADLEAGLQMNGGSLVMLTGANVQGDVLSQTGTNSITIDGATISGSIKTQDAGSTTPFIVRDSTVDASINLGFTSNITITGNSISGSITNEGGNSTPCTIDAGQASSQFSCSELP